MAYYHIEYFHFFFSRPLLSHPISLISSSNLTIQFTLRIVSNVNPILMPFFESLDPGFKIYVGTFLFFDYFLDAPLIDQVC